MLDQQQGFRLLRVFLTSVWCTAGTAHAVDGSYGLAVLMLGCALALLPDPALPGRQ
ncbi:hypothetical protein GCM10010145_53330 [Streptomyces ruber]|uniref:Uncharacterized protein n=3 Tax=Streptomyces TaxID=1883 RepID=A0A918EV43_9ACTN|nr:hypothetical protein GCM10010145_53330 [Streptomyces ruber]